MADAASPLIVRTEHLVGEMLVIDLGHTAIVSDHPEHMGGTGKGPNPGELIKGALAGSAALAIGAAIEGQDLPVEALSVACSTGFQTSRREEGPLPSLTTLSNFELYVVVVGDGSEPVRRAIEVAALGCGVAKALATGIRIDEHEVFHREKASHPARATTHLIDGMLVNRPATSDPVIQPVNTATAVRAEWLGNGRALLHWSTTVHLVDAGRGEGRKSHACSPELLLLAGLSACTSVFVARAAAFEQAQAEVRVIATGDSDPRTGAFAIAKTLEVTGQMRPEQEATMAYFGANCAIGETLRRPARISVIVEAIAGIPEGGSFTARGAQTAATRAKLNGLACDDGACCVPDFGAKPSAGTGQ